MIIRRALPEESFALSELAKEAARYWGYPADWLDYSQASLSFSAEFIKENEVYVADEGGEIRGFYSLGDRSKPEIAQLWIAPKHFGTGVGKDLFLHAKERLGLVREADEPPVR